MRTIFDVLHELSAELDHFEELVATNRDHAKSLSRIDELVNELKGMA